MRTIDIDTEKNTINLTRSQIADGKIVSYGKNNDYPTIIASLIENSQTAKASTNILASFIASGFVNEIGKVEVGKTFTGKAYTLNQLTRDIAQSLARFGGAFVMVKKSLENKVLETKIMRYEDCRFSAFDDNKFSNFVYYGDFSKTIKGENKLKKAKKYPIFNTSTAVFEAMLKETNTTIQVYHIFVDNTYIYPLSPLDAVAYDMNSEYQIQVNRQQELTQGMPSKIFIHLPLDGTKEENEETIETIKKFAGSRGERMCVLKTQFAVDGTIDESYKIDNIPDNRNANANTEAEKSCANNIRKAMFGLPAVLIDYESGNLSNNSGEQINTAYNYYSRVTADLRTLVSESLAEIFENTSISFASKDFTLKNPNLD